MGSGWIAAAATVAGISGVGFALRLCVRALFERCRRRTIIETAAALGGGGVVFQSTAEGDTLVVARAAVPHPVAPPLVERVLDVGGVAVVAGEVVPSGVDTVVAAEAAR